MIDRIELAVSGLSKGTKLRDVYILLFSEVGGKRKLPIVLTKEEAEWLTKAIIDPQTKLPPALEALADVCEQYGVCLDEVFLHKQGTAPFGAYVFFDRDGLLKHIKTSVVEAVMLARVFRGKIYIKRSVFEAQCDADGQEGRVFLPLSQLSNDTLQDILDKAVENEDYELASYVRDELKRRA